MIAKTMDTQDTMKNSSMRPVLFGLSPDDLPLVGPMKHYPNVYLNVGHGTRASTLSFVCAEMISKQVQGSDVIPKNLSPARFHI